MTPIRHIFAYVDLDDECLSNSPNDRVDRATVGTNVGVLYSATSIRGTRRRVDSGHRHTWNSKVCTGTQDLYMFG
jgi:hypothetical protein